MTRRPSSVRDDDEFSASAAERLAYLTRMPRQDESMKLQALRIDDQPVDRFDRVEHLVELARVRQVDLPRPQSRAKPFRSGSARLRSDVRHSKTSRVRNTGGDGVQDRPSRDAFQQRAGARRKLSAPPLGIAS